MYPMYPNLDMSQWWAMMQSMGNAARGMEPLTEAMFSAQRSGLQAMVHWHQQALQSFAQQLDPDARGPVLEASRQIAQASAAFAEASDKLGAQFIEAQRNLMASWLQAVEQMMAQGQQSWNAGQPGPNLGKPGPGFGQSAATAATTTAGGAAPEAHSAAEPDAGSGDKR